MQKNRVSAECFNQSSGYGYNDMGRDTLEAVYADTFKAEDALVRPQITCGTHALALALMSNLRPGDEIVVAEQEEYYAGTPQCKPVRDIVKDNGKLIILV